MNVKVTPFLMFEGKAEEAISFYVSLIPNSSILQITHYGPEGPGQEGSVRTAMFTLGGQNFMCIDSPVSHAFTFTPAMSIFVNCAGEPQIDALFERLSEGGQVLMPLGPYPFSPKFGWLNDRFGVSWQLSLQPT